MASKPRVLILWAAALVLATATAPAPAQTVPLDLYREQVDINRYNQDNANLQRDLANGNPFAALGDMIRMNQDAQRIQADDQQLGYDLYRQGTRAFAPPTVYVPQQPQVQVMEQLVPHPTLPNRFYYPSNPAQLYYMPDREAATQAAAPSPMAPNPVAQRVVNRRPITRVAVRIVNPPSTGVPIAFAIDGQDASVESGEVKTLEVAEGAILSFNRGEEFGDARYRMESGLYEFRYTSAGWDVTRKPLTSAVSTGRVNPRPTREVPPDPTPFVADPGRQP